MYTVIIAEKKHFDAVEQNKLYFKPFLDRLGTDFAFCEWNPDGKNLYECVPTLIRTVGRHKLWRAVIVKEDSLSLQKNPFDAIAHERIAECEEKNRLVHPLDDADDAEHASSAEWTADTISIEDFEKWQEECNSKIKLLLHDKEEIFRDALSLPLQRLSTCLCCMPSDFTNEAAVRKTVLKDTFENVLDPANFEKYLTELDHFYHLEQDRLKENLRRECLEEMLPGDRVSRSKGSMGIILPTEVVCFAERTTETGFFDAQVYWESHIGFEYSDFVGRNMYFDKMRFIASDILPSTHQDYRYNRIRFLYNLLLFALNEVPSGAILPRKLYCLESENNERSLNVIVSSYVGKLSNTIDLVNGQIEKIKREIPTELSDSDAEKLFCAKVTVPVLPNKDFSEEELYVNQSEYGFFSDSFGNEATHWIAQTKKTDETVEKLVKQPRRALKKSVEKLDRECEVDYNLIRAMNSFQMDDVRDYTEAEADKMVSMEVTNIFDIDHYHEKIAEEGKNVMSVLKRRMKRKTNIVLGLVCLIMFFISFLPLIFTNRANINTVMTAVFFGVILTGALLLVFIVTVILLRLPLKRALSDFNQNAKDIKKEVNDAMGQYSEYLSCVANVRRGYRVLTFSENNIDKYDREIRTRRKHKTDMEKVRACILENYGDFLVAGIECDELAEAPYQYDFGIETAEYDYFPPYLPEDRVFIDYLNPGNKVELSSDFVSKITLRMEEIYD